MSSDLCKNALLRKYATDNHQKFVRHAATNKIALIVEPRFDLICEAVIQNFMHFLNPLGWNLCIISYSGFHQRIVEKYEGAHVFDIADKHIVLNELGEPNINIDSYNTIMMDIELWRRLPAEHVLVFQRDCIMFNAFPPHYLEYHFAGANYYADSAPLYGGINGGFSLRKRETMVECLEKITWREIEEYRSNRKYGAFPFNHLNKKNEDVFFTHACEILCKMVPDIFNRTFLAVETDFNPAVSVYHGWDKNFLAVDRIQPLLNSSPYFSTPNGV
jgi:hypothetical protein